MLALILICGILTSTPQEKPLEKPPKPSVQYTIVVLSAPWCRACKYLKKSLNSNSVQTIIQSEYQNDIYFVNIDDESNAEIVNAYLKFLKIYNKQLSIPKMFILRRAQSDSAEGQVLIIQTGSMSNKKLAIFLENPAKYEKIPTIPKK